MNSSLEKEVSVSKRELEEVLGEKALLGEVLLYFCVPQIRLTYAFRRPNNSSWC